MIDSNGQLGTVSSSRRFKEDLHDMGVAAPGLLRLRPVPSATSNPSPTAPSPFEYGLVAEEVAAVYPGPGGPFGGWPDRDREVSGAGFDAAERSAAPAGGDTAARCC